MENPDAIELAEIEINRLIEVCHKQGLSYATILGLLLNACKQLPMLSDAEDWLNQHNK